MNGARLSLTDAPWSASALRLAVAVGASAALHLAIIAGIGVRPFTGYAAPALTIEARLARPEPPAPTGQVKTPPARAPQPHGESTLPPRE